MEAAQPAEQSGGEHVRAAQTAPHGGKLVDVGLGAPPGDPRPVERADRRADDDVRVDAGCEQGVQHSDLHGAEVSPTAEHERRRHQTSSLRPPDWQNGFATGDPGIGRRVRPRVHR